MIRRLYSMRAVILLIAILVLPALACEFSVSTASITNAVTAKDAKGENKEPVGITDTFGPEQQIFHAVVTVANAPSETKLKAVWTAIDVGGAAAPNTQMGEFESQIEGSRNLDFTFEPQGGRLPPGTYKVDIYLNGKLDRTLKFSVTGPATTQNPPTPKPIVNVTNTPVPQNQPKPSGLVKQVTMALNSKPDTKEAVSPTNEFKPDAIFHAVVSLQNAPANTKLKATWYATDVGSAAPANTEIDTVEVTADGTRFVDFTLAPSQAWPIGKYRVEIFVNGALDRVVNFTVK